MQFNLAYVKALGQYFLKFKEEVCHVPFQSLVLKTSHLPRRVKTKLCYWFQKSVVSSLESFYGPPQLGILVESESNSILDVMHMHWLFYVYLEPQYLEEMKEEGREGGRRKLLPTRVLFKRCLICAAKYKLYCSSITVVFRLRVLAQQLYQKCCLR